VRIAGLDHVQLAAPAGCEAAARAFFCDLLGLEELEKPEALRPRGGVWFGLPDGRQLHVGVAEPFAPATKAHPAFRVEGYDELKQRLAEAGVESRDDDAIPGLRRFYADDPFGNRLELVDAGSGWLAARA
jgi:catechol 2,3-dioxygenase-like lactoylglutathione lyase family enzyme